MKKAAGAYMRGGKIYLYPNCKTTEGVWISSLPVLTTNEQDQQLGDKLMSTLLKSTENVPHPKSWKGLTDPLIEAAGVRSFAEFAKVARAVYVSLDGDDVAFIPTRNGPKNAFIHLNDKIIHSDQHGDNLANALLAAFAASEQD